MVHQTKISEQNGAPKTAPKALGDFAHDVLTLAELQAQLFVTDLQECGRRAIAPGMVLVCGAALALACFPIALAALALWVVQVFETSYEAGFLTAVVVGAVLSALLCLIGWFQVRKRVAVLRCSQQELVRNLRWIKKVVKRNRTTRRNDSGNSWRTET